MTKKTVYIDFDGVLNTYDKWLGEEYLYEPKEGVQEFLKTLSDNYRITVFTTRKPDLVRTWLEQYDLAIYIDKVTRMKGPAWVYVDDRCINFNGNYSILLDKITDFKPYWQD